jgi:hypothetical protein
VTEFKVTAIPLQRNAEAIDSADCEIGPADDGQIARSADMIDGHLLMIISGI